MGDSYRKKEEDGGDSYPILNVLEAGEFCFAVFPRPTFSYENIKDSSQVSRFPPPFNVVFAFKAEFKLLTYKAK